MYYHVGTESIILVHPCTYGNANGEFTVWIESEAFGGSQTANTGGVSAALLEGLNLILQLIMNSVRSLLSIRPLRSGFNLRFRIPLIASRRPHSVSTQLPAILLRPHRHCLPNASRSATRSLEN